MTNPKRWLVGLAVVALVAAVAAPAAWAKKLDDAELFIEINATDGDAGIQVFLDGVGWQRMKIFDPDGKKIVDTKNKNSVKIQGITEFFFESAEPSFEVQSLEELMALFPEGRYTFQGTTTNGKKLTGKTTLTHDFPDQPLQVSPVDGATNVDPDNTVLEWELVPDPPGSEIISYEIVVETEDPEERTFKVLLPPDATSVTVPPEFMAGGPEFKWEVLAKEESGNQTISESEFETD
jgi:hypothetical protein